MDSLTEPSNASLLQAANAGSSEAWDNLVERYHRLVWWSLASHRFDRATAEDVYQTVWCRLVENLGSIRNPDYLASWLTTTTRNEAIRVSKKRSRETPTEFEDRFAAPDSPETDAVDNDERRRVGKAFLALDEPCRELLTLLTAEPPLSYSEVAHAIGKPIGSLGPTRARCLTKLEAILEETS
ncbi:MAG: sigma-70 family RNA polymerase sigma factor [Actinobacteria bacterium]|nr:sigma-70 family RNA polymerase sigma factor [Actinomycetota bacterium]